MNVTALPAHAENRGQIDSAPSALAKYAGLGATELCFMRIAREISSSDVGFAAFDDNTRGQMTSDHAAHGNSRGQMTTDHPARGKDAGPEPLGGARVAFSAYSA